jgi:hypothetical protein
MKWQQIRETFPGCWVVVEAVEATTSASGQRQINDLLLVEAYSGDWEAAWEGYKQAKRSSRQGEYYVVHTDRVDLDISVMDGFRRKLDQPA